MIVGGWLEISTMDGGAGQTEVSVHALSSNNTFEDRKIVLEFKTMADEITRATLEITQTSSNIIIITFNDKVVTTNNTAIGYGSNT